MAQLVKNPPTCNVGNLGSIPGLGRSPGEGKGYPFQYSGLKNSMDCIVHEVTKSRKQLSNFHFQRAQLVKNPSAVQETWVRSLCWEDPLEEAWQPSPVFLPGESHGQRSLAGCSLWGCKESDIAQRSIGGLPGGASSKESACKCRRHRRRGFHPWVGKVPWSKKWQPTPVFLLEKFHGQRSLEDCSPWGCKELDTTERTYTQTHTYTEKHVYLEDI